ncbi:MAG TPA: type III-A CRISPR-associated protein Csm2 [Methanoculleus sp.]|nr:type III-A CRISPR-associated protein Csm2 [Methanoculleus sp.]
MARPNYANKGGHHGSYGEPQKSSEMIAVMSEINKVSDLADLSIEAIAGPDGIAEQAAKIMKSQRAALNPTQLRKFFDTIIKIKEKQSEGGWERGENDFFMLYPTLAYAKGRKTIPDEFYNLTTTCLKKIPSEKGPDQSVDNYNRFVNLMESLVAYSKYYS